MKGLVKIPDEQDLTGAYAEIQSQNLSLERKSPLLSQWARFDPRLAEQLVQLLSVKWRDLPPVRLNQELLKQPWPAAFGVLLEMLQLTPNWEKSWNRAYIHWRKCVMSGISPANHELFFIGTRAFASKLLRKDAAFSIKPYLRWGYLGQGLLTAEKGKRRKKGFTLLSAARRQAVVEELLAEKQHFIVSEYIQKLQGAVSIRQAQRDLKGDPRLECIGNTRSRYYRKR